MIKVNMGCGQRNFGEDWVHIDGSPHPHVTWHNITELPFDNGTVDLIYASHVIEYFDNEEIIPVLKEWRRVLKREGILRIAVPDFDAMFNFYKAFHSLQSLIGMLYGKMKMGDEWIYHKTVYNSEELFRLLRENGFPYPFIYDWRKTEHAHIDDHSRAHLPHDPVAIETGNFTGKHRLMSLNVEAKKL